VLRVADLEVDPIRHRAVRAGQRIELTAEEFALLVRRKGDVPSTPCLRASTRE
jgi:two-component system copper resistance phosphate regulon response regulator CusR